MLHNLVKPDMAGYLYYRWRMRWQRCWFSLNGSQLRFFERDPLTGRRGRLIHTVSLFYWDYIRTPSHTDPRRPYILELKDAKSVVHYFAADSEEELIRWKEAFFRARSVAPPAQAIPSLAEGDHSLTKTAKPELGNAAAVTHRRSIRGALAEITPPRHLICIVHGIGSDEERLRENLRNFHEALEEVMQNTLPDALTQFGIKTIYCHWRSALRRLAVYQRMLQLNPLGDQTPSRWRTLINNKLMDILFYLTPRIKRFIQCEVVAQLNEEYERFRLKYPEFQGDISILGHSLGSVISYELLVQQVLSDPVMLEREGLRLRFPVHNLFLTGSPLGHVLNVDDQLRSTIGCWPFRLVNIINPSDPAACRIEPILDAAFADIPPVEIPTMTGSKGSWLSFQSTGRQGSLPEPAGEHLHTRDTPPADMKSTTHALSKDAAPFFEPDSSHRYAASATAPGTTSLSKRSPGTRGSAGPLEFPGWFPQLDAVRRLVRRVRIDYVMRPNFMEDLWGLSAHLNYWRSRDVAYFIIQYILRQQLEREQRGGVPPPQRSAGIDPCGAQVTKSATSIPGSEGTGLFAPKGSQRKPEASPEQLFEPLGSPSKPVDLTDTPAPRPDDAPVPTTEYERGLEPDGQLMRRSDAFSAHLFKDSTAGHDNHGVDYRPVTRTLSAEKALSLNGERQASQENPELTREPSSFVRWIDSMDEVRGRRQPAPSPNRLSTAYPTVRSAFMTRLGGVHSMTDSGLKTSETLSETVSSDIEHTGDSSRSTEHAPARPASL
jgi:hypothetical protein